MYGEIGFTMWGDFISQASERPQTFRFFQGLRLLPMRSLKKVEQERSTRDGEKIKSVSKIFDFRENDYNSAENTDFWARSNFKSFRNFGPLMTNDGVLES